MGPSYANLFVGYIEHKFFNQYNGPKPELYRRYIDDCIGATSSSREDLNQFITADNSFHPALKYTWEMSDTSLAFLDIKVSIEGNSYVLVCTTNPQILMVICCIHLHIHHMSIIPFLSLSFLDFVVFVVTTLTIIAPNKLIDCQHYKRHKETTTIEPTHLSKRVGDIVPGVVVYLSSNSSNARRY